MRRLDELLDEASCGALVVVARSSRDPYLAPFVGGVKLGASFLIAPRGAEPRLGFLTAMERDEAARTGLDLLDPETLEVLRRLEDGALPEALWAGILGRGLALAGLDPCRIALAGCLSAGRVDGALRILRRRGWGVVPGEPIVSWLRKHKPRKQVAAVRVAARGAMAAFRRVAAILAGADVGEGVLRAGGAPLRVGDLRAAIARELAAHGLEQPDGNIVAPGRDAGVPHSAGLDDRVLRPNEALVVDLYPRGTMFADCTRTFCVGTPPAALARAHELVAAALALARRRAKPGVRGWDLQRAVCAHFEAAGFPTPISELGTTRGYVHGLGHGVGYEVHEYPSFRRAAGAEGILEEGDVLTLEPGLYEPEDGWGVRLEDTFRVGVRGARSLTPLPYDLDPRRWT